MQSVVSNDVILVAAAKYIEAVNEVLDDPSHENKRKETTAFKTLEAKKKLTDELAGEYNKLNDKTEKVARLYATMVVYRDAYSAAWRFGTKVEAKEARTKADEAIKKYEAENHALKWTVRRIEKLTRKLDS